MYAIKDDVELLAQDPLAGAPLQKAECYPKQPQAFSPASLFSRSKSFPSILYLGLVRASSELVPSFIVRRWLPDLIVTPLPSPKIHSTSWLDGLRGVAALSVVMFHWAGFILASIDAGYGLLPSSTFLQLPFIKLVHSGMADVTLFFVISGYALSIRPVQLMSHPGANEAALLRSYSSSIFRRMLRLYIPAWASTIVPWLWIVLKMDSLTGRARMWSFVSSRQYQKAVTALHDPFYEHIEASAHLKRADVPSTSIIGELQKWTTENFRSLTIFEGSWSRGTYQNLYNPPMWTIPVEFRASLLLFLVQIAVTRFRISWRILITTGLILWSVYADRFEVILFLAGFLCAQLDPIMTHFEARLETSIKATKLYKLFMVVVLVIGMYLASSPLVDPEHTPGYSWLTKHIPTTFILFKVWFWPSVGGILIVFAISRLPTISRIFTLASFQYLGQISFSIYLVHWFIEMTFGCWFMYSFTYLTRNLDRHNDGLFLLGFGISSLGIAALVICAGDVWCRLVDIPSVKFAKWIESNMLE